MATWTVRKSNPVNTANINQMPPLFWQGRHFIFRASPHNSRLTAQAPLRRLRHGICVAKMLDNVGLRYPHRASRAKAPRTLRPLPLLRFAVSATGGAHLCSIQYYLRFWLSICRTSLAVSALRIMRYCPYACAWLNPAQNSAPNVAAITALMVCIRFSASWNTMDCGPVNTSSVTSMASRPNFSPISLPTAVLWS